jgi:diguanylate cyclase (GGDEF)-like protein
MSANRQKVDRPDNLGRRATGARGTGVVGQDGCLLWVDDGFCAVVRRPRHEVAGMELATVLGLAPDDVAGWELGGEMIQLSAEGGAITVRATGLTEPQGWPWALVVELERLHGPAYDGAPEPPAVFALRPGGKLVAMWGRTREVLGLGPAAIGRRLSSVLREDPLIGALVRRTLAGEVTTGLFVADGGAREIHLFPAVDPADGEAGAVGIAIDTSHRDPGGGGREPGGTGREVPLAELARLALCSTEPGPILEAAARVVHRALRAESCALSEALPGGLGLHVRAAVGLPASIPRLVPDPASMASITVSATAGLTHTADGTLLVPIDGPPASRCLAVRLEPGRQLTAEDKGFVLAAAEIVAAALERLAVEERRRQASLRDPVTGLPIGAVFQDHLRHALARSKRQLTGVALLCVGLDGFTLVRDRLGPEASRELLGAVAQRLLSTLRPEDTLGYMGGNFMVVCEDLGSAGDAEAVAGRLAALFRAPFRLPRFDVSVNASIGIALAGPASEPVALQAEADAAMHRSKQQLGAVGRAGPGPG